MKDKIFRTVRKAALPAMLAAALTIPVGAFAEEHGHFDRGRGHESFEHRGGYDHDRDGDHDRDRRYYRGGWGGGVYYGTAPYYGYGYAAPAPAPACGYYDQYGNWIATACAVPPYRY